MIESITDAVEGAMASPWVLLALFALAAIDALLPVVPSESLVVTAGAFAASTGEPQLGLVIVAAAAGAFAGDHLSYLTGATARGRIARRIRPGSKREAAFDWAGHTLAERGGVLIVVCRYIPGARTAVTLTAGAVGYRLRTFSAFDAIAALTWGVYSALVGYLGGKAFEEDPLKGVALGLALAFLVGAAIEGVRHLRRRAAAGRAEAAQEETAAC